MEGTREFNIRKGYCPVGPVHFDEAKEITFGNSILYASQARGDKGPYAVIPGYKASEVEKDGKVRVKPISDEPEQKVISKRLEGLFEGHLVFW